MPRRWASRILLGLGVLAAFVGVTVGGAYLVGRFAAPGGEMFSWGEATGAGTAIGTVLLAMVTTALALETRLDVRLTAQLAAERHRRVLLEEHDQRLIGFDPASGRGTLSVFVTNVGVGPALNVRIGAVSRSDVPVQRHRIEVEAAENAVVPVDATVRFDVPFRVEADPETGERTAPAPLQFRTFGSCYDRTLTAISDVLVT